MIRAVIACATLAFAVTTARAGADQPAPAVRVTDTAIVPRDPIYFDVLTASIKRESSGTVDAIFSALKAHPEIALLEIQAHTDERGDAAWNLKISQKRADTIYKRLVARGIDPKRLRATGYGETKPLDKGHNPKAWATNRRIELVILQRIT